MTCDTQYRADPESIPAKGDRGVVDTGATLDGAWCIVFAETQARLLRAHLVSMYEFPASEHERDPGERNAGETPRQTGVA